MFAAGLSAFLTIAADVHFHGMLARADPQVAAFFHNHSQGWTTLLFSAISGLGEFRVILLVGFVIGLPLLFRRKWRTLAVWTIGLIGCGILNASLKNLFKIPRPDRFTFYDFAGNPGYSFPSGHTMAVAVAAGLLALVSLHEIPLSPFRRRVLLIVAAAIAALEAFALLCIGVHYLTDVLAALAVSLAWLSLLRLSLSPRLHVENQK